MLMIDAHLDLAMNALEWNRSLKMPVAAIRGREGKLPINRIVARVQCRCRSYVRGESRWL